MKKNTRLIWTNDEAVMALKIIKMEQMISSLVEGVVRKKNEQKYLQQSKGIITRTMIRNNCLPGQQTAIGMTTSIFSYHKILKRFFINPLLPTCRSRS